MLDSRINNPRKISRDTVVKLLERGDAPTIQFSGTAYSPRVLKQINELCVEFGDRLEVRFYGQYSSVFDASVVNHLPDVQWLSVDCLERIRNEDEIARLPKLRKLSLGVYWHDRPDFLSIFNLRKLRCLTLSPNKKMNLDLAPLESCAELEELFIGGHTRNISAIATIPKLRDLTLASVSKRQTLEFVNGMPRLGKLVLLLGSRDRIGELEHPGIVELEIIRVKGLDDLGALSRFKRLRRLRIEDQLQLRSVELRGASVEEIAIRNCKNLEHLHGLLELRNLRVFHTYRTKQDLDSLLAAVWPETVEVVSLYSGSQKWNNRAKTILGARGYRADE